MVRTGASPALTETITPVSALRTCACGLRCVLSWRLHGISSTVCIVVNRTRRGWRRRAYFLRISRAQQLLEDITRVIAILHQAPIAVTLGYVYCFALGDNTKHVIVNGSGRAQVD